MGYNKDDEIFDYSLIYIGVVVYDIAGSRIKHGRFTAGSGDSKQK